MPSSQRTTSEHMVPSQSQFLSQNSFQSQPLPDQTITSSSPTGGNVDQEVEATNNMQSQNDEDSVIDNDLDGEVDK